MSIEDVLKKSFINAINTGDISTRQIVFRLLLASLFAAYIFLVYRIVTKKVFYNNSFNISLAAVTLIVTAIVITIQSNIVVSLGMVGALSIVRFRTAVKESMDLVFMFWAISIGIIIGAGLPGIAAIETVILTVGILVLNLLKVTKIPMILVVHADSMDVREPLIEVLNKNTRFHQIKSQSVRENGIDIIAEVRCSDETLLINSIREIESVTGFSLLLHNGETIF